MITLPPPSPPVANLKPPLVIAGVADPNFKPIKAENLDAKTLNTLVHHLSNVTFADVTVVAPSYS